MPHWFLQLSPWSSWLLLVAGASVIGLGAGSLVAALRVLFDTRAFRLVCGRRPSLAEARREYAAAEIERAFLLLRAVRRRNPDDEASALLMWDVARDAGYPDQAEQALLHLIRKELERGDEAQAVQHWTWLRKSVDVVAAEPSLLLRIAPALQRADQTRLCLDALRSALPAAGASGGGALAARVARVARYVDRGLAEEAIWAALADDRLDPILRAELEADLANLYASEAQAGAAPAALDVEPELRSASAAAAPRPRPEAPRAEALGGAPLRTAQVLEVEPLGLFGDGLLVKIGALQRRVRFRRIAAVAAAGVAGLSERRVLVVDLLLADPGRGDSLRVVRMRSDRFPAAHSLQPGRSPVIALRWLAETLLTRSSARALPDREALRGRPYRRCASLSEYCRDVLGCEPVSVAPHGAKG